MAERCAAAKILRPLTESIAKAPTSNALSAAQLERLRHLDFALQRIAADRPRVTTDMARDFANRRQGEKSSIRICVEARRKERRRETTSARALVARAFRVPLRASLLDPALVLPGVGRLVEVYVETPGLVALECYTLSVPRS